jgi:hypothetical protein
VLVRVLADRQGVDLDAEHAPGSASRRVGRGNAVAAAEIDDNRIRPDDQLDEATQSIRVLRYDESGVPAAERLHIRLVN